MGRLPLNAPCVGKTGSVGGSWEGQRRVRRSIGNVSGTIVLVGEDQSSALLVQEGWEALLSVESIAVEALKLSLARRDVCGCCDGGGFRVVARVSDRSWAKPVPGVWYVR